MLKYCDLEREQIEQIAGALADILHAMGFESMAKDCRTERKHADLPGYAGTTLRMVKRYRPQNARALAHKLSALGLA